MIFLKKLDLITIYPKIEKNIFFFFSLTAVRENKWKDKGKGDATARGRKCSESWTLQGGLGEDKAVSARGVPRGGQCQLQFCSR